MCGVERRIIEMCNDIQAATNSILEQVAGYELSIVFCGFKNWPLCFEGDVQSRLKELAVYKSFYSWFTVCRNLTNRKPLESILYTNQYMHTLTAIFT